MKGTQVQIQRDIESLQSQIKKNDSSISKLKEALDVKLEVLTGELHETNTRIDRIENDITKYAKENDETYERLLSLERYSRDYNLRFYNIPESTSEDCIAKLRDILENDLQLHPNIENAHRIGPFKDDGTPRPILAKFLYRPERFRVIKKKRELLIEEITSSLDQGHYVVSLFLDLSKAFDTVNHQILLNKLKFYGLQQSEYNRFQAYLSKRKQQVYVNGVASDSCVISTGVPQGSILGPLLFIIFINDLPKISTFFSTRLYADDTSLTDSGCDLDSLLCEINNHLPAVYDWLCSNKLTLNLTKTKYIIFMPRQKESYNLYPPLTVANVYFDKSSGVKYLGVYIDCHLTWHDHIDYICGKISKNVNIMVKLKRHVSEATLVSLYYFLIYPYLTYACTLWGNNYNAQLSQIVKLQNKAVRVINDVPLMEPITPHYLSLHLLKFPDIVKLNTCMLFYDYFHHEKFPNISVSLVSELHIITIPEMHHLIKFLYPHFELILGDFAPPL